MPTLMILEENSTPIVWLDRTRPVHSLSKEPCFRYGSTNIRPLRCDVIDRTWSKISSRDCRRARRVNELAAAAWS